jgi:hypothetical protein
MRDVAPFKIGDQVRLSDLGRLSFSKSPNRRGRVVRVASTQTRYRVQWQGQVTAEYVHWTYLELDAGPPTA